MPLEDTLAMLNPWWEGEKSPVVKEWESRKVRWRPFWLSKISLEPFSLNVVLGPRLVGKTTGLHLLAEEELSRRSAFSVFYLNLDLAFDLNSFKSLLDSYLRMRRAREIESSLILLDEVTSVKGWWRLVKGYLDAGVFRKDVLVVTGSSSLRLKGEVELFPGRMGKGREVEALPLSFREYLEVMGLELRGPAEALLPEAAKIRSHFRGLPQGGRISPLDKQRPQGCGAAHKVP